ncbi:MAG: pyridoxamine 5'-phosphate oxidase [Hyphomicrobium sp.]
MTVKDTEAGGASDAQFTSAQDPFALFSGWLAEATRTEPNDPNAMAVASVDEDGLPNVRMVLLKGLDTPSTPGRGFVFYTNFEGTKGRELQAHPKAALVFHWKSLERQVRVRGLVSVVSGAEADEYYASRARLSRIGAWASKQSRPLEGRFALETEVARYTVKYAIGEIPRPPYWSGFRVTPLEIEFWMSRPFRLHDRVVFRRPDAETPWSRTRLFP